jgi:lysophospholipase L1-like esterase
MFRRFVAGAILASAAALPESALAQSNTLNLAAATADYLAARAQGGARVVILGDSLTFRAGAVWENLVELSGLDHGPGGLGYQGMSLWTGAFGFEPADWSRGIINEDTPPHWALDGLWMASADPSRSVTLTFRPWTRSFKLHYVAQAGGGSFTLRSGVLEVVLPSDAPSLEVRTHAVEGLPQDTFTITTSGNGPVTLLGVDNLPSQGATGPTIHRAANGGWGLDEVLRRNASWEMQLATLDPDLVIVNFGGQNDVGFAWDGALWQQYLEQLCDRVEAASPDAEIVLVSNYASTSSPELLGLWNALAQRQRQVAIARGYGFIDVLRAGGAYEYYQSRGFIDPDGLHFTDAGGAYVAGMIHCAIDTAGACLEGRPCHDTDFNNDGVTPDLQDVVAFVDAFAGGPCAGCDPIDFNRDGVTPDLRDVVRFLDVFAGGACLP